MRDREIVAAIVAGDPAGLTLVYDRYAAVLHAYCATLLTGPADTAEAVRDTFIVAVAKLTHLRDPDLLRPWLYAVVRNECQRRTRRLARGQGTADTAGTGGTGGTRGADKADEAGGAASWSGGPAGLTAGPRRPDPREPVAAAIAALGTGERAIVELSLRHDLDDAGLAAVLGVSRHQAHALAAHARRQFEASLSALLVASAGPEFCADLAAALASWDGELTPALRKRLGKHIRRCQVCAERKRQKLRPAMLLGLRPALALPANVWRQLLTLVADTTPAGKANRTLIAERAEPLAPSGFPVPLDPPAFARAPKRSALTTVSGIAALAVLCTGTVLVTAMPHNGGSPRGQPPAHGTASPGATAALPVPQVPAGRIPPATPRATAPVAASVSVTTPAPMTVPPSATTPSPTSTAGTLTEQPATLVLRRPAKGGQPAGSFMLTADGGPVAAFTITATAPGSGFLIVTPVTGSLAAGQSVLIRVTLRKAYHGGLHTELGVQPGGLVVIVIYRLPRP